MAYIGQPPFQEFTSVPTKDSFTGDGSTTTFDLANDVVRGAENALEVFVDNVRQEPGSGKAFTLGVDGSNNYRRITFTAAPANGASIYVINDKTNLSTIAPINSDFNGAELVLDADADTSLHADTDDEIDIRVAGNDVITIKQSSGDGIITIPVDAKDLQFTQFDGNKVLEINDGGFVGVGGNSNAPGEIRIFEDTDNGSNYSGFKAAANTTSSVAYQLPAADGSSGTHLTTNGSGVLSWAASVTLANDSNNRVITGTGSGLNGEANLTFDGSTLTVTGAISGSSTIQGTTITATTAFVPDASDGAALGTSSLEFSDLFLADAAVINLGADQDVTITHVADTGILLNAASVIQFRDSGLTIGSNADGDLDIVSDGTAVDSINIESAGGITLDAGTAGSGIIYEDDGTEMMRIHNSSSDVILESKVSDKDIIFKVNDGGSSTEVARFDGDVSALKLASGKKLMLGAAEETLSGDGTDITFEVGSSGDINIPANIGLTFGDDGEKIEGDGTDLTISGNNINLTATADVVIPANVGITFGSGEKIEGDSTDLTITSGAKINLTATSDVHIPNNVGIVFGGDSEKIEGDGTDMTISANNLTIDAAADINLDADGADVNIKDGGTTIVSFTNSSSDAVITAGVQDKDIIFKGDDGGAAVTSLTLDMSNAGAAIFSAAAYNAEATLTDASTISWNAITQPVAKVTLGANRTLGAASGGVAGAFISLLIIQDGTGSRTLTFNAAYEFKEDTAPTLTTTAAKGDLFVFRYNGSKWLEVGRNQALTLS